MDIDTVRELRDQLRNEIQKALDDFIQRTGCLPEVTVDHHVLSVMSGSRQVRVAVWVEVIL